MLCFTDLFFIMCSERQVQVFSNTRANFIFFQPMGPIIQSVPIPQLLCSPDCSGRAEGTPSPCQDCGAPSPLLLPVHPLGLGCSVSPGGVNVVGRVRCLMRCSSVEEQGLKHPPMTQRDSPVCFKWFSALMRVGSSVPAQSLTTHVCLHP